MEPALYRDAYRRIDRRRAPDQAVVDVFQMIQRQEGFLSEGPSLEALTSPMAQHVLHARQSELSVFMAAVGLAAATTTSAVMRLRPGVNRLFPQLSAYARSVRSEKAEFKRKARRLFGEIQTALSAAIGAERMAFIETEVTGPIKIVSDAPIEWLPVRGLPLVLRHQTSRINATPGNLMIGQLALNEPITLPPEVLQEILVVSSFGPDDKKLSKMLRGAIDAIADGIDGKLKLTFADVSSVEEFEAALNAFEGAIMVFDGHGAIDAGEGVGTLMINDVPLDVWSLRGRVRVPPIVILSACDTQGLDAPSHATVGNGFLALGALTVMATLLPVDGRSAAMFIARFLFRLAQFLNAGLAANQRVLNWTEVVTGMQRMFVASEILDVLVSKPDGVFTPRGRIQSNANILINSGDPDWYEKILAAVAAHRGETLEETTELAARIVARSEAIRYIQLGHPENILIDDGRIRDRVVASRRQQIAQANASD